MAGRDKHPLPHRLCKEMYLSSLNCLKRHLWLDSALKIPVTSYETNKSGPRFCRTTWLAQACGQSCRNTANTQGRGSNRSQAHLGGPETRGQEREPRGLGWLPPSPWGHTAVLFISDTLSLWPEPATSETPAAGHTETTVWEKNHEPLGTCAGGYEWEHSQQGWGIQ